MAFKDLSAEVAELFEQEAYEPARAAHDDDRAETWGYRHRSGRHGYVPPMPRLQPAVSCAVCRRPYVSRQGLDSHFSRAHPAVAAAYVPFASKDPRHQAERDRLVREIAQAERQRAAAEELFDACQQRIFVLRRQLERLR